MKPFWRTGLDGETDKKTPLKMLSEGGKELYLLCGNAFTPVINFSD